MAIVAVFVIVLIIGFASEGTSTKPAKSAKPLNCEVSVSRTSLMLSNPGEPTWTEAVIYINGTPPFTYKATVRAPKVGETGIVDLTSFVNKSGERFNPFTHAVTEIWVGGSGFDFAQRTVKR